MPHFWGFGVCLKNLFKKAKDVLASRYYLLKAITAGVLSLLVARFRRVDWGEVVRQNGLKLTLPLVSWRL